MRGLVRVALPGKEVEMSIGAITSELSLLATHASSPDEVGEFHAVREAFARELYEFEANTELLSVIEKNRVARKYFFANQVVGLRDQLEMREVPIGLLIGVGNGGQGQGLRGSDGGALGFNRVVSLLREAGMIGAAPVSEKWTSSMCVRCRSPISNSSSSSRVAIVPNARCLSDALERVTRENVECMTAISESVGESDRERTAGALREILSKRHENIRAHGKWKNVNELIEKLQTMPELATTWHRRANRKLIRKSRDRQRRKLTLLDRQAVLLRGWMTRDQWTALMKRSSLGVLGHEPRKNGAASPPPSTGWTQPTLQNDGPRHVEVRANDIHSKIYFG